MPFNRNDCVCMTNAGVYVPERWEYLLARINVSTRPYTAFGAHVYAYIYYILYTYLSGRFREYALRLAVGRIKSPLAVKNHFARVIQSVSVRADSSRRRRAIWHWLVTSKMTHFVIEWSKIRRKNSCIRKLSAMIAANSTHKFQQWFCRYMIYTCMTIKRQKNVSFVKFRVLDFYSSFQLIFLPI